MRPFLYSEHKRTVPLRSVQQALFKLFGAFRFSDLRYTLYGASHIVPLCIHCGKYSRQKVLPFVYKFC